MAVLIDQEIANLCRSLTDAERAQLEESIVAEGCRDALVTWGDILIDGHNRHAICHRLGLPYETVAAVGVRSREEAINWVIRNQLGRRNLTDEERSYLIGKRYQAEKQNHGGQLPTTDCKDEGKGSIQIEYSVQRQNRTVATIARETGAAPSSVQRADKFAAAVDAIAQRGGGEAARLIRSGQSGMPKSSIIAFSKRDDVSMEAFNAARLEYKMKRSASVKKARTRRNAPKAPINKLKKKPGDLVDPVVTERMRKLMHAVMEVATCAVRPQTLLADPWPQNWRANLTASLPAASAYLCKLEELIRNGETENG